jgi:hypothetical protein
MVSCYSTSRTGLFRAARQLIVGERQHNRNLSPVKRRDVTLREFLRLWIGNGVSPIRAAIRRKS